MKSSRFKNPSKRDLLYYLQRCADCINWRSNCVNVTFVIAMTIVFRSHVWAMFGLLKKSCMSRVCAHNDEGFDNISTIFWGNDKDETNVGRELGAIRHDLNVVCRRSCIILKDRRRQRLSYTVITRIIHGNLLQQQIFPRIPAINALLLQ